MGLEEDIEVLSFEKSNPEIRNFSVSASDLIGIYK